MSKGLQKTLLGLEAFREGAHMLLFVTERPQILQIF